jgi:hypothetical protein
MHLGSLRSVYRFIEDVTPKTIFIECCPEDYRRFFRLISPEMMMMSDDFTISTIRELAEKIGFRVLVEKVNSTIAELGGKAFIRWDSHYPKDMCSLMHGTVGLEVLLGTMENACLFTRAEEFFLLSLNSMRTLSFVMREGEYSLYPIAVREPVPLKYEYRVVIFRGRVRAVLQYYYNEYYGLSLEEAEKLAKELALFAADIANRFPVSDMVLDVAMMDGKPVVVEVTPPLHTAPVDLPGIADEVDIKEIYGRSQPLFTYRSAEKLEMRTLELY